MNLVSIIIPTKNSAMHLERCLESIKAQTYPEIEIIVVDNHSSDATLEIAARYGMVISGGPERSAQFNQGAAQARGTYLYRVDGDFELEPEVVGACVDAVERDGADIVAVPNRSETGSYWMRVRRLERNTYLDDDLIVAARFWRRSAFESVGGFDESLVSCEDYDLHNRMIAAGFQVGRVKPCEIHLGEPDSLWEHARKSFYYGPSAWRYVSKHPSRGARQMFPLRFSYWRHRKELLRHPWELLGLVLLKIVQYSAAGLAILLSWFGFLDEEGKFSSSSLSGLVVMSASMLALLNLLPRYGLPAGKGVSITLLIAGLFAWLLVGKRIAKRQSKPLSATLVTVSLCYSPYLLFFVFGNRLPQETWLFAFSTVNAVVVACLVYLSAVQEESRRWIPWIFALVILAFSGFFIFRLVTQFLTHNIIAQEIIFFDQALWTTAKGFTSGSQLLNSTILDRSVFSEVAAPVILLYLPLYWIGLGSPLLLLASQVIFVVLIAFALYRMGEHRFGNVAAFFLALAYLVYFITPRLTGYNFQPQALGVAALIFGLDALERERPGLYFLWAFIAVICGEEVAIALAVTGVLLIFREKDRWVGVMTVLVGAVSAWIWVSVFKPYFGGAPLRISTLYEIFDPTSFLLMASQPQVVNYIVLLLAPLAFISLLGAPWLLPALPALFFNILLRRISAAGPPEVVIDAFLFIAAISGLSWVAGKMTAKKRKRLQLSGAVLVFVACFLSARFLNSNLFPVLWQQANPVAAGRGDSVLALVPDEASLATQNSLAISFAHRSELYLLPRVEDAKYILVDMFASVEAPQMETYETVVHRVFNNPDYGIRAESDGVLLFERGLNVSDDIDRLARAQADEIEYPSEVILADTVAYRGFSIKNAHLVPEQAFVITTYWESLAPVQRPYQIFTAYPGGQQFHEAVFGLYPTTLWQPGELVRHRIAIILPNLPDGDDYEIVAGLWFDTGERALRAPSQLLGEDVVRIARITVTGNRYQLQAWRNERGN